MPDQNIMVGPLTGGGHFPNQTPIRVKFPSRLVRVVEYIEEIPLLDNNKSSKIQWNNFCCQNLHYTRHDSTMPSGGGCPQAPLPVPNQGSGHILVDKVAILTAPFL